MPDVPRLPGVPNLSSYGLLLPVVETPELDFGDDVWGIFLDGESALDYQSTLGVAYKQEWSISDYPVEQGGFQSYDKVQHPFAMRVRITSGPSFEERQAILQAIDDVANSLDLYDIVTPERTYTSCNVVHYDYERRSDKNVGRIEIDVWFEEVRVTATTQLSNTQQPAEAGQQNIGTVQAQDTPEALQSAVEAGGIM